jgi:hypothetical protein
MYFVFGLPCFGKAPSYVAAFGTLLITTSRKHC